MKILQIGNTDIIGRRFNGFDLDKKLRSLGFDSQFCVRLKNSDKENVWQIANSKGKFLWDKKIKKIENFFSIQSLLNPFWARLLFDKHFYQADVIHYHLIHTSYFSLLLLPLLSRLKPTVWTLHDPWAMTGHCVYPYKCKKWQSGCYNCPDLSSQIPMEKDQASLMWKIKKYCYRFSKINIIVASEFMHQMAKHSPLLSHFNINYIPFGLDLNLFKPNDSKKAKKKLGILPGKKVLTFRATEIKSKGLPHLKSALRKLKTNKKICLLTLQGTGLLDEFKHKYQVVDLGWQNDNEKIIDAYNASDVFIMPSIAEAFGMMAIEAMACAKPVVVFKGTSLEKVIHAPEGGIAVPMGDTDSLRKNIEKLIERPDLAQKIGGRARELAVRFYNEKIQIDKLTSLYIKMLKNKKNFRTK